MRSDRDKRTDTEREIDDFLSKFENPADELSADINSYLDEQNTEEAAPVQTFSWKVVEPDPANKSDLDFFETAKASDAGSGRDASAAKDPEKEKPSRRRKKKKKKEKLREVIKDVPPAPAAAAPVEPERPSASAAAVPSDRHADAPDAPDAFAAADVEEPDARDTFTPADIEEAETRDTFAAAEAADAFIEEPSAEADTITDDSPADEDISSADEAAAADAGAASGEEASGEESPAGDDIPDAGDESAADEAPAPVEDQAVEDEYTSGEGASADEEPAPKDAASQDKKKPAAGGKRSKKKKAKKRKAEKGSLGRALFLKKNKDYDPSQGATYVRDGKTVKNKEYKFSFLKLLRDIAAVGVLCMLAGAIAVASIVASAPKYDYKDVYSEIDTASIIYNDKGKQIDNIFYTENRKIVKYEDMPQDLINAFVAIEDKTFWKHHGFNWTRMIGAVLSSLTGSGRISGTSTITQQLARNVYLADIKSVRSIRRKLLEMYYASRLEHFLSKEQIIEAYLNTIYLGHGCYGVNAAARTYFSKNVQDLDLVECASLAALPQSPDTYALLKLASEAQDVVDSEVVATDPDTVVTNDLARERRQLTLDLMLAQNLIDKDEYDKAYDLTLNDFINPSLKSNSSIYSYFHEYLVDSIVADLMDQYGMEYEDAERTVYTKGLQIYSTVDSKAMQVIADEFQDGSNFPYVTAPRDGDGNLLNNDGQIALYNYHNFFDKKGNFTLRGKSGDVKVNSDGSFTIMKDHKLHIYETEVDGGIDYSLEFKNYYFYDDNDILYSIAGGYLNIPSTYKSADEDGNIVIDKAFFEDPYYDGVVKIKGKDVVLTSKAYTLSPKQRQPQAAMTIVKVGTGEVKAMVGGRQFGGQKVLNRSLNARQPGSSIKPLAVYGAALQKSYDLAAEGKKWSFTNFHIDKQGTRGWGDYVTVHSSIEDERTRIEGKQWPNNFNNAFSGKNTFKTAIQKSINTCAVKLVLQVGSEYSIDQLKRFGLTTVQDDLSDPVNDANPAALGLGAMTIGVEPLEMALAYAAFPGGGKINTPVCYTKVLDRNGEVLLEGTSKQSEAMNEGVAWIMQEVLKSVVSYNNYMYVTDVQPGGKTGTTNDQYDIWFDGFTPSYAGSIWIGTDENVEMSSMSTPAAALWGKIINQIPNAKKGDYPKQPSNVIQVGGEYFTKGTETGLSSWSSKEQAKKERKEAYNKWLKEREKHKKKVVDVKEHDEPVYETKKVKVKDAWTETIHHDAIPEKTHEEPVYDDEGNQIGTTTVVDQEGKDAWDEYIDHPAEYETQKVKVGTKHVKEVWHYEYEKGWRDGDFKYKGNS